MALALLAASAALAPGVTAQDPVFSVQFERRAWLGFSYQDTETRRPGERTTSLTVVSTVANSPAAKAGLQEADVILRINGLGATQQLLGSLGSALNPGDTVTMTVRRAGSERDLRIVAAEPPEGFAQSFKIQIDGDSIRRLVRVFTDSIRVNMDSTVLHYLQRGDSASRHMFMWRDSLFNLADSARVRVFTRAWPDSTGWRSWFSGDSVVFHADSGRAFAFSFPRGENIEFGARPLLMGMRAVAGAELHELNPELARYFAVERGVLVMNAAENTPARRAGLRAGDVITAVAGEPVTTISQVRRAIERASGSTVRLEVIRERERRTLELQK
jgi:membrane-associated protease RseP (regulator of RpoE activity)